MKAAIVRGLMAVAFVVGLAPSASASPAGVASGMDPAVASALQSTLDELRAQLHEPGMSLAIRLRDGSVWTATTGRAEVPPNARVLTAETPLAAGSITKMFVGALVMEEVERGHLALTDLASRWLRRRDVATVTIEQLLRHTSGLADYFKNPDFESLVFGDPTHHWTPKEILGLVGPPVAPPGRGYHYSNTDAIVLGRILEKVSGMKLGDLLRSRLLEPLGLSELAFQDVEPTGIPAAQGYLRRDHAWIDWSDGTGYRTNTSAATVAWAAGALLATPRDLVRWAHALFAEGMVVAPASLNLMTRFNKHDYGLAAERFFTTDDPATRDVMWGHSGSLRGFEAQLWYVPSRDVTIALMANRGRVSLRPAIQQLLGVLFSAAAPAN